MTEILWFRLLNPNGSCQLLPRTSSISTGLPLRRVPLLTDRLNMTSLLTGP